MINIECEKVFSAKLNKNARKTLMITIPMSIVKQYEIEANDWIEMAFIKRIKGLKGR